MVGGLLLAIPGFGFGWSYLTVAALYGLIFANFLRLPEHAPDRAAGQQRTLDQILEGFRFVRDTPPMPKLVAIAAIAMLLGRPYLQLMPVFAARILLVGSTGLGLLLAASGLGAVAGSLAAARIRGHRQAGRWQPILGIGLGIAVVLFALSPSLPIALTAAALAGFASSAFQIVNYSLVIARTEPRLYGRVAGIYQLTYAFGPLGAVPVAALADRIGAQAAVALGGGLLVAAVLALAPGRTRSPASRPEP